MVEDSVLASTPILSQTACVAEIFGLSLQKGLLAWIAAPRRAWHPRRDATSSSIRSGVPCRRR
eukprot:3639746-Alexandrium_andersonii.AAC.1